MISAPGLRWILTAALAVLAAYALWRAVRASRRSVGGGISHLLHAVMAVAMAVMCWPSGMELPAAPQVFFFVAAALWYPVAAAAGRSGRSVPSGGGGSPRTPRLLAALPHTVVMASMAWMLYAMDASMSGGHHASAAMGHGHGSSGGGHHGAAPSGLSTMSLSGAAQQTAAMVLAAAFLALALWWLARGFDAARRPVTGLAGGSGSVAAQVPGDLLCHGVMAFVMAVMFVLLT